MKTRLSCLSLPVFAVGFGFGCAGIDPPSVYPEPPSISFSAPATAISSVAPTASGVPALGAPAVTSATLNITPIFGKKYCSTLTADASRVSVLESSWAWALTVLGAGAFGAGSIINVHNATQTKPSASEGIVGTALILGSSAMIAGALALFSRSMAADTLAQTSASAMTEEKDRPAYDKCVMARASWDGSRSDASKIGIDLANQQTKARQDAEKKADEAATKANEAATKANEAATKAAQSEADAKNRADEAEKKAKDANDRIEAARKLGAKKKLDPELMKILDPSTK